MNIGSHFLYHSVGALKQFYWKTFFVNDELWILQKTKRFQLPLKECFGDPRRLIIFLLLCVYRGVIWRNKIVYNQWTVNKKKNNNRFQPLFWGMFLRSVKLLNYLYYFVGALKKFSRNLFFQSANFEFYKKSKAFNSPLMNVSKIQGSW